jgi:hypothetical protein
MHFKFIFYHLFKNDILILSRSFNMDLLILKKYINMQIASFTGFIKALLYDCFLFFQIF